MIWRKVENYHRNGWLSSAQSRTISYRGTQYVFPGRDKISDPFWGGIYRLLTSVIYPKIGAEGWVPVKEYFAKWQRILRTPRFSTNAYQKSISNAFPTPRSYSETEYGSRVSMEEACLSYEQDVWGFATWLNAGESVDFIADLLPESILEEMSYVNDADEESGLVAGSIHHIPKKGTFKRRSIASPNRFLQAGLAPCRKVLRTITQRIPNNCQFDQGKLDGIIYNHVVNDYAGSVDLSQATDWMPLSWFEFLSTNFGWFGHYETELSQEDLETEISVLCGQDEVARQSYELFIEMTRSASWENGYHFDKWLRGQPLGTWPSFEVLTITHTLFVESCALHCRRWDSPYAILGDDVVIFDENTRNLYVSVMRRVGSPLSMHKSYDGRLAEFAGKYFIPNQKVAYSPGHAIMHWNNLFDYQKTAKVCVPYDRLPKMIRKRFEREVLSFDKSLSSRPQDIYKGIQAFIGATAVDQLTNQVSVKCYTNLMVAYLETPEERKLRKKLERIRSSTMPKDHGFAIYGGRVGSLNTEVPLAHKAMPKWYKDKVRPVETDALIRASFTATRSGPETGSYARQD
jgi:hypothetical protein